MNAEGMGFGLILFLMFYCRHFFILSLTGLMLGLICPAQAQQVQEKKEIQTNSVKFRKASKKVESGYRTDQADTLAQGYYELGESYFQKGDFQKSEEYYRKAKQMYEKIPDADGVARSSRALGRVQESQNKTKEAVISYQDAVSSSAANGTYQELNKNDIRRLTRADSLPMKESLIQQNIKLGLVNRDTTEIISNFTKMGELSLETRKPDLALDAYKNAYWYSRNNPEQALQFNQKISDVYLQANNIPKAIETKKELLNESFVQNSTELTSREITSLAGLYFLNREDSTATRLLQQSYRLATENGHTLAASYALEKLDSVFSVQGKANQSLLLYKDFMSRLPVMLSRDSSIADNRLVAETETRIRELENEKALKDDLIRRKNVFNYWLTASLVILAGLLLVILFILRKLRIRNKKIALQSLRREMNPHFIFNSLNSVNQFIAQHNELEANRYLTRFSTLMRRVMENSTHDFVLFAREFELLQHYLELEKSRFPETFDFTIRVEDAWLTDEQLFIPGMLVQPHLENAIWHGLRYADHKGMLELRFSRRGDVMDIEVEDNGIGLANSEKHKTDNQRKRSGRGIRNTQERINILNELYGQTITCTITDKPEPHTGVLVRITVPVMKKIES